MYNKARFMPKSFIFAWSIYCFFAVLSPSMAQPYNPVEEIIQRHLDGIRGHEAALRGFFQAMPKGGDIHHHYSGAVYAESFVEHIAEKNFWVNTQDYSIDGQRPKTGGILRDTVWRSVEQLQAAGTWAKTSQKLIEKWSILGYTGKERRDQYFFNIFVHFAQAVSADYKSGLREIKARALAENVQYIETIFEVIQCNDTWEDLQPFEKLLLDAQARQDTQAAQRLIATMFDKIQAEHPTAKICVSQHNAFLKNLHESAQIDDDKFTMRYQNYVLRMLPPTLVFAQLCMAFESANTSMLIVGVNLVGPENDRIALRDCWLHYQFFKFLHTRYARVDIALHAGEMTGQNTQPEHLTWHIGGAMRAGKAKRIGHCVSLPYEKDYTDLLREMASQNVVAEINLSSNDFILDTRRDAHPIMLLHQYHVPMVIATDDAGILRTSLTSEFVRLSQQYPQIKYRDIKKMVFNSINFSFIKEQELKKRLILQLENQFSLFEQKLIKEISSKS
jgi:adenosine deaminase